MNCFSGCTHEARHTIRHTAHGLEVEAQTAVAFHPLNNSGIADKVCAFVLACLKDYRLRVGEDECELMLLTEALQGIQVPLQPSCTGGDQDEIIRIQQ